MNIPEIDEMLATRNVGNVSQHTFTRWQRAIRDEVLPKLADLDAMKAATTPLAVSSRRRGGEQ